MTSTPTFLDLPERDYKPRTRGLTHVLDKGMTPSALQGLLQQASDHLDILKLGWGIAVIDRELQQRQGLCQSHGVTLCLGGTLVEIAAAQGRVDALITWAASKRIRAVEVSNGLAAMTRPEKAALVTRLSREFVVFAETGAKDDRVPVNARAWSDEMESDLLAGAQLVIAEGRESGTVGLYNSNGSPRADLVQDVLERIPVDSLIFEAPHKHQQTWFIQQFGPNVNLGNVASDEVMALETLRLGLRADTADLVRHDMNRTAMATP